MSFVNKDGSVTRHRTITGAEFWEALAQAGVLDRERDASISRIVIDAKDREPVVIYVERFADTRLLNVATSLQGIEITTVDKERPQFIPGSPEAAEYLGTDYYIDSDGKRRSYKIEVDDEVREPPSS